MSEPILGVDIAKKKFDVALLVNGKLKHKVFTNDQGGFAELTASRSCSCLYGGIEHLW
jgi:transposase